jgi:hypothetical protein
VPAAEVEELSTSIWPVDLVTLELWDEANGTKIQDIVDPADFRFQAEMSTTSSGQVKVENLTLAEVAAYSAGRHIRFLIDDVPVWAMRISPPSRDLAAVLRDGSFRWDLTINGESLTVHWRRARVEPLLGPGSRPRSLNRPFSWACPEVPISAFTDAVDVPGTGAGHPQNALDADAIWPPLGFPSPVNEDEPTWVASRPPVPDAVHPIGRWYAADQFTLSAETTVGIFFAADDRCRAFLQGITIEEWTDQFPTSSYSNTNRVWIELPAGTYDLRFEVENYAQPDDLSEPWGDSELLYAVHSHPGAGTFGPSTLICGSSSTTKCLDYPTVVPAPTPGVILAKLLDEAQDRGPTGNKTLQGWTFGGSFSATTDSAGATWDTPYEIAPAIGDNYEKVLDTLGEFAIDYWADPVGLVLWVWNKGTILDTGPELTVGEDGSITALKVTAPDELPINDVLVAYKTDELVRTDSTSVAAIGRYEGFVSVPAADIPPSAEAAGDAILGIYAEQEPTVTVAVDPYNGPIPLSADLPIGASCELTPLDDDFRMLAVTGRKVDRWVEIVPEFGVPQAVAEQRQRTWLQRLGDGTLQGRSSIAQLITDDDSGIVRGKIATETRDFSQANIEEDVASPAANQDKDKRLTMLLYTLEEASTSGNTTIEVLVSGVVVEMSVGGIDVDELPLGPSEYRRIVLAPSSGDVLVPAGSKLTFNTLSAGDGAGLLAVNATLAEVT